MSDQSLVKIFWALAVISFPTCILLLAIIFKEDIRKLLSRIGDNKVTNNNISDLPLSQQSEVIKSYAPYPHVEKNKSKAQSPEINFLDVDVCKNKNSGQYFIVIEEHNNDIATLINPKGEIKDIELKFFDKFEIRIIGELLRKNLITNEQLITFRGRITIDADRYFDEYDIVSKGTKTLCPSKGGEPDYIKSYRNMLKSSETWPSRMLAIVKHKKRITRKNLRDTIAERFDYSTNDTNGSFHASLRLLLVDGYINIEGTGDDKIIKMIQQ